jgi:hypothetical protein
MGQAGRDFVLNTFPRDRLASAYVDIFNSSGGNVIDISSRQRAAG